MGDVTQFLSNMESGDTGAAEKLLPMMYDELRRLAVAKMLHESPDHTLQPTALVHDAYVRLVDVEKAQRWDSPGHFFAAVAEAMRRILVERARQKNAIRNGGEFQRHVLFDVELAANVDRMQVLSLDDALNRLEKENPRAAELVKLRFFAGLSADEAAGLLGVSPSTSRRIWVFARAWLRSDMEENSNPST
ncbi:ECF sigma factor [Symmachiella macrocystis]|uniref:ECF sigma factor n=2 Tax=Symmachiella macrocystis TaxID=2527985 RepID=A0A5C6BAV5_9PLAN|nr:ECF sigma factor [Symmachiella macrocystis]